MTPLPDLSQHPDARLVQKLAIDIPVAFATEAGVCDTLEGPVRYQARDAILTGVQGEHWPIGREKFERRYLAVAPNEMGTDGLYQRLPSEVWALLINEPIKVPVGDGQSLLNGKPGDWLLQYEPGDYGVIAADIFASTYRLL